MKKSCSRCGRIHDTKYVCKESKRKTDNSRVDNKIYNTRQWKSVRATVLEDYNYICMYSMYVEGRVVEANNVHHIVEVLDDDSLCYEYDNLITLEGYAHKLVHKMMNVNKKKVQEMLRNMIKDYKNGCKELGKYREEWLNISPPVH